MYQCPAKLAPRSEHNERGKTLVVTLAMLVLCFGLASLSVNGQIAPKATDKAPAAKPSTTPRPTTPSLRPPRRARPAGSVSPSGSASEASDNFLNLGDQFAEKSKWHAAEVAYKEAVRLWSGNADALVALGFLYVDKRERGEAFTVYNRLRPLDSSLAQDLLTEINKIK